MRNTIPPQWPFVINRQSSQSQGLIAWYPATPVLDAWIDPVFRRDLSPKSGKPSRAWYDLLGGTWCFTAASNTGFQRIGTSYFADATRASLTFWLNTTTIIGTGTCFILYASSYNLIVYRSSGQVRVYINSAADYGRTPTVLATNTWYHVAITFDGNQSTNATKLRIYINGVSQSLSFSGTIPAAFATGTQDLHVGIRQDNASPLDGWMTDVRFYDRVLSAGDVNAIWSPATRWDLYWRPRRRFYYAPEAIVGTTAVPIFYHHRQQQGMS